MKNNPEEIPANIFDWLHLLTFEELDYSQKEEVLAHFTAEEYNQFHATFLSMKDSVEKETSSRKKKLRDDLLLHFDEINAVNENDEKQTSFFSKKIDLWKAAAVFFLFCFSFVLAFFLKSNKTIETGLLSNKDTVFVTKNVIGPTLQIHDTVYIYKTSEEKNKTTQEERVSFASDEFNIYDDSLNTISIEDFENSSNEHKGNSLRKDTLSRKHEFITL